MADLSSTIKIFSSFLSWWNTQQNISRRNHTSDIPFKLHHLSNLSRSQHTYILYSSRDELPPVSFQVTIRKDSLIFASNCNHPLEFHWLNRVLLLLLFLFYHNREPIVLSSRSHDPVAHGPSSHQRKPFTVKLVFSFTSIFVFFMDLSSEFGWKPEFSHMQTQGMRRGDFNAKVIGKVSVLF